MRARRRALSERDQARAAENLAARLSTLPLFQNSRRIAFYFPDDGEIDPTLAMAQAWSMKKRCFLPTLVHVIGNRLRFAPATAGMSLAINRYGIPEPEVPRRSWRKAVALDLILLPLVAFDLAGGRVGMGAGYYDQTLAFLRQRNHWHKPRLLGLAHELQRTETVDTDPWDIPLDGVVTDRAYYPVNR